jgi:ParB family chromosome partitioning protein
MAEKRPALGRGLSALIPDAAVPAVNEHSLDVDSDLIRPNRFQPRAAMDETKIDELARSIRANGIIQPIVVRRVDGGYEIVAGERRWRASQRAGLLRVPVVVRDIPDERLLALALIENIQREDLNPIDEAKAFQALIGRVGLTHDQVSERVGKQRSSITNSLRLLGLPVEVQEMVSRGTLTAGHGRALLGLESPGDQLATARYVHSKAFSVRRTEALIQRKLRRQSARPRAKRANELGEWETKLQQRFATHVTITPGRKGGKVEFEYYGQEDLERLLEAWGVM